MTGPILNARVRPRRVGGAESGTARTGQVVRDGRDSRRTTRKVTERAEYRHVVPGHPPLCDLSALDAEHRPEIKFRLGTGRWKGTHGSLLCAIIRRPGRYQIPLGDQMCDRLNRVGKDRRVLTEKFLKLIKTPNVDARSRLAMSNDVRSNELVEYFGLTAVPCVHEPPNHGLVLLGRGAPM